MWDKRNGPHDRDRGRRAAERSGTNPRGDALVRGTGPELFRLRVRYSARNDRLWQRSGVLILSAGVDSEPAKSKSEATSALATLACQEASAPSLFGLDFQQERRKGKGRADYHSFRLTASVWPGRTFDVNKLFRGCQIQVSSVHGSPVIMRCCSGLRVATIHWTARRGFPPPAA